MHAHIHPASARFTLRLSQGSVSTVYQALRPVMVSSFGQSLYREPLRPRVGVTSARHGTQSRVTRHYPSFIAHTGSCAGPKPSPSLGMTLVPRVCAGCCAPLLDRGPSQHYLRNPCVGAWTPTPWHPCSALARFFPQGNGLTSEGIGSACTKITAAMQLQQRTLLGAAAIPSRSGSHTC